MLYDFTTTTTTTTNGLFRLKQQSASRPTIPLVQWRHEKSMTDILYTYKYQKHLTRNTVTNKIVYILCVSIKYRLI